MEVQQSNQEVITARELETRLRITRQHQVNLRKRGILQAYKLGRRVFFIWEEVIEALKSNEAENTK